MNPSAKILFPSGASRRVACPGSHKLEGQFPQDTSDYAVEGNAAHWVATQFLTKVGWSIPPVTPEGTEITNEMIEGAELYTGFIQDKILPHNRHIEERMHIETIHPDCWGAPDCWGFSTPGELHIFDYKFGRRFVEVYENWQLIEYAAGILKNINGSLDHFLKVNFHIIQPRSFHPQGQVRTWSILASNLRPYFNKLEAAEHASTQHDAPTIVSDECSMCRARHACPTLQKSALKAVDVSGSSIVHNLNPAQLSTELRTLQHAASLLDARISGLETEALLLIERGERLPHFMASRGKGRQRWIASQEKIAEMAELYGVDITTPKLITPKQAIELGLPEKSVNKLSDKPIGALKLIPIDIKTADKVFGND
jgi:hypothetical protein